MGFTPFNPSYGLKGDIVIVRAEAQEFLGTVDFGVLTVREDEMEPMARRCRERAKGEYLLRGRQDYLLFDVALGTVNEFIYRLALVRSISQGAGEAQRRTSNMIEDLDPSWLMLVGIAGGTPSSEFTLGDVVVATELHEFSVRAALFGKDIGYRLGGGAMAPEVENFIGLLVAREPELRNWNEITAIGKPSPPVDVKRRGAIYGDKDWRKEVRKSISYHFPTKLTERKPKITTRPFAGGNILMKDDALWQQWRSKARQVEAVEMELEGVYTAARTNRRVYPVLVSKGISDIVGFRRDERWTTYACETAAAAAIAMLGLRPIEPKLKPQLQPQPQLPQPVQKKLHQEANGLTEVIKSALAVAHPIPVKAFISYKWTDKKRNAWVEKLAADLRAAGIEAFLDRWEVKLGDSFTEYMSSKIDESDVVLFVITPESVAAVEKTKGQGGALKFEMQMSAAKALNGDGRIIGIYREGGRPPHYLRDKRYVDFREDSIYQESLTELVSDLLGANTRPPLGTAKGEQPKPKRDLTKREMEIEELQEQYASVVSEWWDANYTHMDDNGQDNSSRIKGYRKVMDDLERRLAALGATPRNKPF